VLFADGLLAVPTAVDACAFIIAVQIRASDTNRDVGIAGGLGDEGWGPVHRYDMR